MAELVFGVIGAVVGLGGLALTFVGNRQQRRQARELGAREAHLRAQERETERRQASVHASMLRVEVTRHASTLDPSVSLWRLTVTNGSTQPFTGVALRYDDQALGSPTLNGHLNPGASKADTLPVADGEPDPARCVVEFTDVAGRLWRRRATGDLRLGRRGPDGQLSWDAGEAYFIHVGDISGRVAEMRRYRVPRAYYRSPSGCSLVVLTLFSVYLILHFALR
ncbi:hypothetical protein [Streptomyces sp. NPDC047009]|uniref:hypothetical protein n=1 Tax=unclassified Streptomyces TaxID=2593676 RepID=UPI0033EE4AB5